MLTCIRQEIANEWQSNTVKDLLLPDMSVLSAKKMKKQILHGKMLPQNHTFIFQFITDWEIQGVKQVLYSYKILFFQTTPLKSYKLSKLLCLSLFHEKFKRYLKI